MNSPEPPNPDKLAAMQALAEEVHALTKKIKEKVDKRRKYNATITVTGD